MPTLKKRIYSIIARTFLFASPFILSFACPVRLAAQENEKIVSKYTGDTIVFKQAYIDTVAAVNLQNPTVTDILFIMQFPMPKLINGITIHYSENAESSLEKDKSDSSAQVLANHIMEYLLQNMAETYSPLEDGKYWLIIGGMVLDNRGRIAYSGYKEISTHFITNGYKIPEALLTKASDQTEMLLDKYPKTNWIPNTYISLPYFLPPRYTQREFIIEKHKLRLK